MYHCSLKFCLGYAGKHEYFHLNSKGSANAACGIVFYCPQLQCTDGADIMLL
jgi:hypothetical protein